LAQRIEQLLNGQQELFPPDLDTESESTAQRYAAQVVRTKARVSEADGSEPDYQNVDIESLDVLRPRSVGIEHAALSVLRQVGLDQKLEALGFTSPQLNAAIGTIVARMAAPGSELATHAWLQEHSGLGELIGHDFGTTSRRWAITDSVAKLRQC
jgi:hypothetical protein